MQIEDFDYEFPPDLVATEAMEPRSHARLLSFDRASQNLSHHRFIDLPALLREGDCIVFNQTWVLPARFFGQRETGGKLEFLFVAEDERGSWVWMKGQARAGERVQIPNLGDIEVLKRTEQRALLKVPAMDLRLWLKSHGEIPIPPYIESARKQKQTARIQPSDQTQYQTTFAKESSHPSFAAPTASLHFDQELLDALKKAYIDSEFIELQVGEGTFAPVTGKIETHTMHAERFSVSEEVWHRLEERKRRGQRIIGVGTTVMRSLETAARMSAGKDFRFFQGAESKLFIKPPFDFQMIDSLITNFHFPKTTLLLLVGSFLEPKVGPDSFHHQWKRLYEEAVRERYRLFSYGDGMMIL